MASPPALLQLQIAPLLFLPPLFSPRTGGTGSVWACPSSHLALTHSGSSRPICCLPGGGTHHCAPHSSHWPAVDSRTILLPLRCLLQIEMYSGRQSSSGERPGKVLLPLLCLLTSALVHCHYFACVLTSALVHCHTAVP